MSATTMHSRPFDICILFIVCTKYIYGKQIPTQYITKKKRFSNVTYVKFFLFIPKFFYVYLSKENLHKFPVNEYVPYYIFLEENAHENGFS